VLALGIEQLSTRFEDAIVPETTDAEGAAGLPLPGLYALQAGRYLHEHARPAELLAHVAVKNRRNGAANPRAARTSEVSYDEVLASRMIAEPLTVLQCCPLSDGAGAAVIGRRRDKPDAVAVRGSSFVGGRAWPANPDEPWGIACVRRAVKAAEQDADIDVAAADVLEVHDAFTIGEVLTVEAMGLCTPGTALDHLEAGDFNIGGRWAINPSGGLLSRGHPLGATGLAQVAEAVWQLTGRAGDRQHPSADLAVVETMGGGASGLDGNAAAVIVLGS
jgi:acetyl-CoA C-acetyltransferase